MSTSVIAAASYEGSLFTWSVSGGKKDVEMEMTSGFHCAMGSVRAVALSKSGNMQEYINFSNKMRLGKYLVCGGNDERVRCVENSNTMTNS